MRTNIDIDDELMKKVLATGEFKTKKEAVHEGLKLLVKQTGDRKISEIRNEILRSGSAVEKLFGAVSLDNHQDYKTLIEQARTNKMGYDENSD